MSNEEDVKKAMGIVDWRHASKDKILDLASSLQNLDKDTAIELLQKFPRLADVIESGQNSFWKLQDRVVSSNESSGKDLSEAFSDQRRMLEEELKRPGLSDDERRQLRDEYKENVDKQAAKDSDNKKFLENMQKNAIVVVGLGIAVAGTVLGAKGKFNALGK